MYLLPGGPGFQGAPICKTPLTSGDLDRLAPATSSAAAWDTLDIILEVCKKRNIVNE